MHVEICKGNTTHRQYDSILISTNIYIEDTDHIYINSSCVGKQINIGEVSLLYVHNKGNLVCQLFKVFF
jgi:hypothetical protein